MMSLQTSLVHFEPNVVSSSGDICICILPWVSSYVPDSPTTSCTENLSRFPRLLDVSYTARSALSPIPHSSSLFIL